MHNETDLLSLLEADAPHDLISGAVRVLLESITVSNVQVPCNWHPLGFFHMPVAQSDDGRRLRFHVWPANYRSTQNPPLSIHDHAFALTSRVLVGSMSNITYHVSDQGVANARLYDVLYDEHQSVLRANGRLACVSELRRERQSAGAQYVVPIGTFHESEVALGSLTATMVLTETLDQRTPVVIGPLEGEAEYTYLRRECSIAERQDVIGEVLSAL